MELGWNKIIRHTNSGFAEKVSVVIAVRNESKNIETLMNHLAEQSYDSQLLEIIVVDDHSTDDTYQKLLKYKNINVLKSNGQGKKMALDRGINLATGSVILTTDGDCFFGKHWVRTMVKYFIDDSIKMVVGPVLLKATISSFFQKVQIIEFASLIGSGAGAIANQQAFMCNGANLAFRSEYYKNTRNDVQSGDDVFLLHHIKSNGGKIVFAKDKRAIVSTNCKTDLKTFLQQRIRWSAKSSSYNDLDAIKISLAVFITNLTIVFSAFYDLSLLVILLTIKFLSDYPLLKKQASFFEIKKWKLNFLALQLIYPVYIVYIAMVSQFSTFYWKGRKFNK
ncbi:MAG: glycosyltransferase [Flavobacteriales bacterium]